MKRLLAVLFAGLALMTMLAPAAQAKRPWLDPPGSGQPCICDPTPAVM